VIGLVYDLDGWVIHELADEIQRNCRDFHEGFNTHDNLTEVGIYMPYYLLAGDPRPPRGKRTVALFTHLEPGDNEYATRKREMWNRAAEMADRCWAMSAKTAMDLPADKTFILEPPASPMYAREHINVGIVGHLQPYGRKREDLLPQLASIPGIRLHFTNGQVPPPQMPGFFREMDYILVISTAEGGPLCVKEAIEMGTPVIAPDVGWAWDYPVVRYSGDRELFGIMAALAPSSPRLRWADFTRELKKQVL